MSLFINARKACWACVAESQLDYVFCKTLEINEQYMRQDSVTFHWCSSIILNGNRKVINRPLACLWDYAANMEYRTIRFFYRSENLFCFVLQIGCIPRRVALKPGRSMTVSPRMSAVSFRKVTYQYNMQNNSKFKQWVRRGTDGKVEGTIGWWPEFKSQGRLFVFLFLWLGFF